jgi:thioredoxin 1
MGNSRELTEENIDSTLASSKMLILLDFWNESCMVCKRIAPMLENLAEKYVDNLILARINTDRNPMIADRFAIKGLPTLLFIKNVQVLEKISGVRTNSELSKIIDDNI